jgi:hypothetical protein
MSMSQDTENFQQLRRLLALKRHEQPPPGYFNNFSSQVIARIKLGEGEDRGSVFERLLWEAPWLERIWAAFEAKPILAGVFGVAVCGLLITGMVYTDKADVSPVALISVGQSGSGSMEVATVSAADHPLLAKPAALEASSTNPIGMATDGPLLGELGKLRAQPASFTFSGRN